MKPQTAFVRSDSAAKLNPVPAINPTFSLIIHPGHPKHDYPFRFYQPFQYSGFLILRMPGHYRFQRIQNFLYSLVKFRFSGVFLLDSSRNTAFSMILPMFSENEKPMEVMIPVSAQYTFFGDMYCCFSL